MKTIKICRIVLVGLLVTRSLSAANFYVDATQGDDAKEGREPASAWRSLARVNRARLVAGDHVFFRRGQQWRGQLIPQSGDASGVVAYGAFGEGAKPVLLGSVAAERPADWLETGKGIWATAPLRLEPVGEQADLREGAWWIHQEGGAVCQLTTEDRKADGGKLLRLTCTQPGAKANHVQLSVPGLALQEGEYYFFNFQASSTQPFSLPSVSIMKASAPWSSYASVEGMPLAIGTNWAEYSVRFQARQSAQDARLTCFLGGALPAGTTFLFRPGKVFKAQSKGLLLSVDVGNIIFDEGQGTGVKKWSEADLRQPGDYYYDRQAGQVKLRSDSNPATRYKSIELALRRHIIDQSNRGYVVYENLDLRYGAAHGIGGANTHHVTVRGCDLSFIGGGHQFTPPGGKPVRFGNGIEFWSNAHDCLVEDCRIWEIYDAALTNQGDGTNVQENITYRRNVIWNSEYSFEYWNRGTASQTRNILFEQNTCVDAGMGWGHNQRPDPNGQHLMFYDNSAITTNVVVRHNIFCNSANTCLRLHGRDWTTNLSMDYNCWFQAEGQVLRWGNEEMDKANFQAFLQKRKLDVHSVFANPKFLAPAQHDYQLAPDSPVRTLFNKEKKF